LIQITLQSKFAPKGTTAPFEQEVIRRSPKENDDVVHNHIDEGPTSVAQPVIVKESNSDAVHNHIDEGGVNVKIYTKSGDKGETSLIYGERVSKESPRVEAYGTCDEANSMIGMALAYLSTEEEWQQDLHRTFHIIQTKLFHVGAELATPTGKKVGWPIDESDVTFLEEQIDRLDAMLPSLTNFVLPGGSPSGSALHVARTIARRAERNAITVRQTDEVNPVVIKYLNRLSDFLFVGARYVNHQLGAVEPTLHEENKA
jgi:cob(I)alamin adenosyltransferase